MPENSQPNWYDWSMEHWGTKWDAMDSEIIMLSDEKASISFVTAWDCPFTALKEISKCSQNLHSRVSMPKSLSLQTAGSSILKMTYLKIQKWMVT